MPEMFGTHHSKMLILLRHDETAQVVIHTANMIPRDWRNMTQGAWISPALPLLRIGSQPGTELEIIGSGARFKTDLLNYLRAYDTKRVTCRRLVEQLEKYDFSAVSGALIASVPGRHDMDDESPTRWGWAAMKRALPVVPLQEGSAEVVIQISSIATLGPTDTWLRQTLFKSLGLGKAPSPNPPSFKVIFPTPDEIRKSLDGYESGGSIHTKIQSAQQQKQLQYLKPMLCHWANDAEQGVGKTSLLPYFAIWR
jgi:tyrosyl-DNA phosphodiesterase 1